MEKTRLAIVSQSMNIGGAEILAAKLAGYLDKEKFEIKLFIIGKYIANQIADIAKENGIIFVCLNLPHSFSFKSFKVFSKALNEFNPDVVHVHLDVSYSWIWSILHNKPLVSTQHSDPFRRKDKRVALLIKIKAFQKNLKIIGCSKKTMTLVKECFKIKNDFLNYIYNPIDINCYKPSLNDKRNIEKFVAVGRLHEVKNYPLMLEAFKIVIDSGKQVKLYIAGTGPLEEHLKAIVSSFALDDFVFFLGNVYDIPSLLTEMDVLLLSSISESCPMVILEAMASALPVVATNVGGVSELVLDNGIVVESGDVKSFSAAIIKLIESPKLVNDMKKKALLYAKKYDKSVITKKYELEYYTISKKGSRNERKIVQ